MLENVSFTLKREQRMALVGENGAGKSTLLNILHGVFPATTGEIRIGAASRSTALMCANMIKGSIGI